MSTRRKKLRFPMFFKFLVACMTLARLLIFGGTLLVKKETQFRNRVNILTKHLRRYQFYQDRIGKDMTGMTEVLAANTALVAAVAAANAAPTPPVEGPPGGPPGGPPSGPTTPPTTPPNL